MKYLALYLALLLGCYELKAQTRFHILTGINIPQLTPLNETLSRYGYQPLNGVSSSVGLDASISTSEFLDLHFIFLYNSMERNFKSNKGTSFRSSLLSYSMGSKLINKYKSSLETLIGVAWNTPSVLKLQNAQVSNNPISLTSQIVMPQNQVTELTHKSSFLWHVGTKYRFQLKTLSLTLNVGYYGKPFKSRWELNNTRLTEPININPVGFYSLLGVTF